MNPPLKNLADFKRRAVPGARFLRSFPGRDTPSRIVTVAYAQSNAVVFPPNCASSRRPTFSDASRTTPAATAHGFGFPKPAVAASRAAQ